MKRVRSACIVQTLVFSQKPELLLTAETAKKLNREEFERYKLDLERARTRYVIVDETEEQDGSIVVHVKKQYNAIADISEYF